jgi:Domain of unknown function DUF29
MAAALKAQREVDERSLSLNDSWQRGLTTMSQPKLGQGSLPPTNPADRPTAVGMIGHGTDINEDFYSWLLDQASALRKRRWNSLDCEHLAEELEAMAVAERRELLKRLTTLLSHLLKLRYQPRLRSRRRRMLTVVHSRTQIRQLLEDSPGLKGQLEQLVPKAYSDARRETGIELGHLHNEWIDLFPEECPWSLDQLQDDDFYP